MAAAAYRRLRQGTNGEAADAHPAALPPQLRSVQPQASERYVSCVPLVPLKIAAGAFGDSQHIDETGWD